jgi:hypothetical protein
MVDVAQLVESRIVIPVVVGSSPIVHPKIQVSGPLAQLVEQLTLNQLVVSSNLTRPTNTETPTLVVGVSLCCGDKKRCALRLVLLLGAPVQ